MNNLDGSLISRISRCAFRPIEEQIDHRYLNELPGLENPTSENLAQWIWERMKIKLPNLSKVVLRETCTTGCIYEGGVR